MEKKTEILRLILRLASLVLEDLKDDGKLNLSPLYGGKSENKAIN